MLTFPDDTTPKENSKHLGVAFRGEVAGRTVPCAISDEALRDVFGTGDDYVATYRANRDRIHAVAARKYAAGELDEIGRVFLMRIDFDRFR